MKNKTFPVQVFFCKDGVFVATYDNGNLRDLKQFNDIEHWKAFPEYVPRTPVIVTLKNKSFNKRNTLKRG